MTMLCVVNDKWNASSKYNVKHIWYSLITRAFAAAYGKQVSSFYKRMQYKVDLKK